MALQMSVAVASPEVLSGETLVVHVTLTNAGPGSVDVPGPMAPDLFEYVLSSAADGRPLRTLGYVEARGARFDDTMPSPVVPMAPLAAGAAATYEVDLAAYAVEALAPGRYLLNATYATPAGPLASPRVPLTVAAPQAASVAMVLGPTDQRLAVALVHVTAGRPVVFQRESREEAPDDGT